MRDARPAWPGDIAITMILIDASRLSAARPNRPLFTDVSVTLRDGDRLGVVGINGSGKTTLLRTLAREIEPQASPEGGAGVVRWGRGARVAMLPQRPTLPAGSVGDAVGHGWQGRAMLERLGMGDQVNARTDELSGGQVKRVALARLMAGEHDVVILDEPTNHLDLEAISFLESWLAAFRGGVVLVTHDRHVLDAVTTRVLELDRGRAYLHVPAGRHQGSGYAAYLEGRDAREEQAEVTEQARKNLARRELAWLRRGAPARSTKPKARVDAARAVVEARAAAPAREGELVVNFGSQRLGSRGIEMVGVGFSWPDGTSVLHDVSIAWEPGDRIGIVGPNGAGKSTLLDLVAARLQPSTGSVERGATVRIGYYDQTGREMPPEARVRELVAGDKGEPSIADVVLMKRFWFDGDAQFAPVGTLSGGERRRLQLLLTMIEQPNVLLLDEPTNDLDLDTLRALEDLLEEWPGIAVVVSHDRAFIDRTVEQVVAVDGDGSVREVRGGVAAWLAGRTQTPRPSATTPAPQTPAPQTPARPTPAREDSGVSVAGRDVAGMSPSTLRRRLTQAVRELDQAREALTVATTAFAEASDHRAAAVRAEALAHAQAVVTAREDHWLELAERAESLGIDVEA